MIAAGAVLTVSIGAQPPTAKETPPRAAVPVEPIAAILEAFRSHTVVAIGNVEFRGNEQSHAFQLSLIRSPGFASTVNDILVEFGSARYQEVVDRFVRGEEVAYESLRPAWQNTTQIEYEWDLPIYEDFFRAVRAVNASLPRARQLRVLLGDPPMDWDKVHSMEDLRKAMGDRDGYAVDVLQREVFSKGRRALVIYGGQHLIRKNTLPAVDDEWARGIVARLEKNKVTSVFKVLPETRRDLRTVQPGIVSWPTPSLAILRGTALGSTIWDSGPQRRPVRMEEQVDAILYLGPPSAMTTSKLSPALCSDAAYMAMRLGRLGLVPPPPGATFTPAEQLREYCAHPDGYKEIPDREPAITELIRKTLRNAAQGRVNPENIAPESRDRLVSFLQRDGPRYLGSAGALESLTLLVDTDSGGKRVRRYRSVFASGLRIIWTVELSSAGVIVSLAPQPE
ncbi:MAG: hypothetical protein HYX27_01900 [Acidobacteria bacterium]|nr:hypothetical protein [Acidobacteriota bacterium]